MAGPPMPLSTRPGKKDRRAITLANPSQPLPGFAPALVQRPSKAPNRTREHEPTRPRRPYLFETLRAPLLTRIVADTLDWDVLMHHDFDASLNQDRETYYLLWVAVHKVLAEKSAADLTGDNVNGSSSRYQKTRHTDELLDAVLEQFLAELGNALLEFVDGTHCTILDPRTHSDDDPSVILAKARSLIARFEKLGRDRQTIMVAIPATEAGIAAAAGLQWEHGINVNLTSVSGVIHAAACAQAGAAAVTIPVSTIRDWHRDRGGTRRPEEYTGAGSDDTIENAQTIAAYFQQHSMLSTQILACNLDHLDDACSLAALDALSFDADQARSAEWYNTYPNVRGTIPDSAVRRAASFFTPPPLDEDERGSARARASRAQRTLKHMDAAALSTFSAVVHTAPGSARAAMSLIADIARREIDWQLALLRPMYAVVPPGPQSSEAAAADNKVVVAQRWPRKISKKRKRKCRAPEDEELLLRVPDTPPSPRKRAKLASGAYRYSTAPDRSGTPPPEGSGYEEVDDVEGEYEDDDVLPNHLGGRLGQRLAIGGRYLPPVSEHIEEECTTAVGHAREEEAPEFETCRRCQSGPVIEARGAPQTGGEKHRLHRDSDLAQVRTAESNGEL